MRSTVAESNLWFLRVSSSVVFDMAPAKRSNYTIKQKVDIIREHKKGVKGFGLPALSKKYNIPRDTLRGWLEKKSELEALLQNPTSQSRRCRRLPGGGRKAMLMDLEIELDQWIAEKNKKGLRVKDQYIQAKARNLHAIAVSVSESEISQDFVASTGWLANFKSRYNYVSRRQTTTRTLPEAADEICRSFLQSVHSIIQQYKIKPSNIINADQVPRYFETEPSTTIAKKGAREVLMRKGGSSHKRFTVTFSITGDGQILMPHILFSGLKNKPALSANILCDVNKTGMFSDEILRSFVQNTLQTRRETAFYREPVLLLIDSYGPHIKLA
jgi:hypothetical protein